MPSKLSDLGELLGLVLVAVAVGFLAGLWWGVAVAGASLVVYCNLLDSPTPSGDA